VSAVSRARSILRRARALFELILLYTAVGPLLGMALLVAGGVGFAAVAEFLRTGNPAVLSAIFIMPASAIAVLFPIPGVILWSKAYELGLIYAFPTGVLAASLALVGWKSGPVAVGAALLVSTCLSVLPLFGVQPGSGWSLQGIFLPATIMGPFAPIAMGVVCALSALACWRLSRTVLRRLADEPGPAALAT
jgi:hypothetical protein